LTQNDPKLIFYPGRHGLTYINSVGSVLTGNDDFDPKQHETHFLPRSTWFDPYYPVDSVLTENDSFDPKQHETHFFTLIDTV